MLQLNNQFPLMSCQKDKFYVQMQQIKRLIMAKENRLQRRVYHCIRRCRNLRQNKYEVKYLVIDRSTPRLHSKIKKMRDYVRDEDKMSSVRDIKSIFLNQLMHDINEKFGHLIHDHHVLQKIIASFFKETQKFFIIMGFVHIFFNFFPFVLQVYNDVL